MKGTNEASVYDRRRAGLDRPIQGRREQTQQEIYVNKLELHAERAKGGVSLIPRNTMLYAIRASLSALAVNAPDGAHSSRRNRVRRAMPSVHRASRSPAAASS